MGLIAGGLESLSHAGNANIYSAVEGNERLKSKIALLREMVSARDHVIASKDAQIASSNTEIASLKASLQMSVEVTPIVDLENQEDHEHSNKRSCLEGYASGEHAAQHVQDLSKMLVQVKKEKNAIKATLESERDAEREHRVAAQGEKQEALTNLVRVKQENIDAEHKLRRVETEKARVQEKNEQVQNRLAVVKQEAAEAEHKAAIATMLAESLVVEKRELEDDLEFTRRIAGEL